MNLVGNARGGAHAAAEHFLNTRDNEHVEVYELRGFVSDDLSGALNEIYAISRGTRCKQFLYSLSVNPPPTEKATTQDFEDAIERVEAKLGLADQPRAIVFHEKKGRRHAHCVWSRIDLGEMKAIQMSYDREKLKATSRELFLHHGWQMPPGLIHRENRDPRNYSLAEWQQARRTDRHPNAIKRDFEDAWAVSDTKESFAHALQERGYHLAKGNRRSFVAVDMQGEVYAVARKAGVKTKDVSARLGDSDDLPDVDAVKAQLASEMAQTVNRLKGELEQQFAHSNSEYETRRTALVEKQRLERTSLKDGQDKRRADEARERQSRFRKGVAGLWDRLNGTHRKTRKQNEREAEACAARDTQEKDALVFRHLGEQQRLTLFRASLRRGYGRERMRLERDAQHISGVSPQPRGPEIER